MINNRYINKIINDFITNKSNLLISKLTKYLTQGITHDAMKEVSWKIIEDWEKLNIIDKKSVNDRERAIWACVFSSIHLCDDEHWNDGCTKETLAECLDFLTGNKKIPEKYGEMRP